MLTPAELTKLPLFAKLAAKELDYLAGVLPDIHVAPGEYVVHEGDSRGLIIVVEGKLEVIKLIDGADRVIGYRLPGTLFGEVPIVLNGLFLASMRAVEPSRVIRVEPKVFHTLAAAAPEVSATVGAAAMERIGGLQNLARDSKPSALFVIGPRALPSIHALRTFLHRNQVDFQWMSAAPPRSAGAIPLPEAAPRSAGAIPPSGGVPIVRLPDGTELVGPTIQAVASAVGLSIAPKQTDYDVVIIGGGPAGMAAAVYAASEGLQTLLVEREAPGGQAGTSSRIENYLGFPFGVSGDELATRALQQARRLGAEIVVTRSVERIDAGSRSSGTAPALTPSGIAERVRGGTVVLDGGETLRARALVLALGVTWRQLGIESLDRLTGLGVYYGASRSEASATHGRDIFLVGAGNSAGQAALFFANHARSVTLVVRGDALAKSMSHYLIRQLDTKANIRVALHSEVAAVHGREQLEAVDIIDRRSGEQTRCPAGGLFVFIGADAATDWLPAEIARDARGFVLTGSDAARTGRFGAARDPYLLETTVPGVFAVGDIRAGSVKRVASAVGDGSLAIALVRQYLEEP